jgi:integrase/recombinase XerD
MSAELITTTKFNEDNRGSRQLFIIDTSYDPVVLYLKSLDSNASQITMVKVLFIFARWYFGEREASPQTIQWSEIEYKTIQDYQKFLQFVRKLQPTTINTYINAIRGVLKKSNRIKKVSLSNKISDENYKEILEIKLVRGSRLTSGIALTDDEVTKTIEACAEKTIKGIRDKALISVFIYCGLRLNEMCELRYPDCLKNAGWLTIIGKGNKQRKIPLNDKVRESINEWIDGVRGEYEGWMFCRIWRSGALNDSSPLANSGITKILKNRATLANITFSAHDLRRTFGTRLLTKGVDVFTVQKLMGHSKVDTTRAYDKRSDSNLVDAVNLI